MRASAFPSGTQRVKFHQVRVLTLARRLEEPKLYHILKDAVGRIRRKASPQDAQNLPRATNITDDIFPDLRADLSGNVRRVKWQVRRPFLWLRCGNLVPQGHLLLIGGRTRAPIKRGRIHHVRHAWHPAED